MEGARLLQKLRQGDQLQFQLTGARLGHIGIVCQNLHAERLCSLGNLDADTAQPDDPQRLAVELAPHEAAAPPCARLHGGIGLGDVAADG